MKQIVLYCLSVAMIMGLSNCAQQVAPTGGMKDETPPKVLAMNPAQETLNYQNQDIEIEFDEFIKLDKLKKQFIASPPLKHDIETKVRGKELIIQIEDTLQENTTYVLNFGDALVDFRENNPLTGFSYVFSTGNTIDTFKISGVLINAFDRKVVKGATVMLYKSESLDSLPYLETPFYVSRTKEDGQFEISNIKAGNYSLFALEEGNVNYLFDKPDERIAFLDHVISIPENSSDTLDLFAFVEDHEKQYVKSIKENGPLVVLEFNREIDSVSIVALDTSFSDLAHHYEKSKGGDSLVIWFKELNDLEFDFEIQESQAYTDTLELKIDSLSKKNKLIVTKFPRSSHDFFKAVELKFNRPIKSINPDSISLFSADSMRMEFEVIKDTNDIYSASIIADFQPDSSYFIEVFPNSFIDVYGYTHDTLKSSFSLNSEEDFGLLEVRVSINDSTPQLLQLLNGSNQVIKVLKPEGNKYTFPHLQVGNYGLKLILDANNNGEWDTGSFPERRQAERVFIFEETISIRQNWDREIEWIIK